MMRPSVTRHAVLLASVPVRLATLLAMSAVIAGLSAADIEPTANQAVAGTASHATSAQETADANRTAIIRSTTSVATHDAVAAPAVASLAATATASTDLPVAALDAYERAAQVIDSVRPACHLPWSVLAAIGQVESDHGRSGGGELRIDGTSTKLVRGVVLDGSGSRARVVDTDGGLLDGNRTWDRAVGPMQFLPSTWLTVRVDGDGDGYRSPDDIDDASLAAAVFLCAWDDDFSSDGGATRAVGQFSHSPGFAPAVLSLARTYAAGSYLTSAWADVLASTWSSTSVPESSSTEVPPAEKPWTTPAASTESASTDGETAPSTGSTPSSSSAPTPAPSPSLSPVPAATADPPTTTTPSPTDSASGQSDGTQGVSPTLDPVPSPTSSPTPNTTPSPAGEDTGPTAVEGTLTSCGTQEFCVDGKPVDFGVLDSPAAADFDHDGSTESRQTELTGLVDTHVSVTLQGNGSSSLAATVNGLTW